MTPYDAAMAGVIVAGMVWGAVRGVTWQIAGIASLVLGYAASHTLSAQLTPYLPGNPLVARLLSMIVMYVGVSATIFVIAWTIRATLHKLRFEAYDRHLGMLLGGCEGALLGLVVTLFVVGLEPDSRKPIFSSGAGRIVSAALAALGPVLPDEARKELSPFLNPSDANVMTATPASTSAPTAGTNETTDTLTDLVEKGEKKIGKAIVDQTTLELQQATGGSTDGRTVERR